MTDDLLPEEIETLLEECQEKLDSLDVDLVALGATNPKPSRELINRIFREFHSIKGAAGYLKNETLKELGHATESVVAKLRDGQMQLSQEHVQLLLAATDRMSQMIAQGQLQKDVQLGPVLERLNAIIRIGGKGYPRADVETAQRSSEVAAKTTGLRPLRVLVVEDDFSSRLVLQSLLAAYGECHIAVNGSEAVEAFRAARKAGKNYDLICMDVRMPEMDGQEAVERIRKIELSEGVFSDRVKIFMTTAIRDMKTIVKSFKAICDAYLFKPIDGESLAEHLISFRLIGRGQELANPFNYADARLARLSAKDSDACRKLLPRMLAPT